MIEKMARDGNWEKTYSKLSVMASIKPQMELEELLFAFCTRCPLSMLRTYVFLRQSVTGFRCEASLKICGDHE